MYPVLARNPCQQQGTRLADHGGLLQRGLDGAQRDPAQVVAQAVLRALRAVVQEVPNDLARARKP